MSCDYKSQEQSVVVSVNSVGCTAPAAPTVGSGLTVCRGNTATLSAGGCEGGTVTWSSGISSVTPDATTSYTAVCSLNGSTSESSASLTVTVVEVAAPSVSPDHASVRRGETVTLSASCPGGQTVVWTAPDNFNGGSHSPSVTTEYRAKYRDGNGCESGEGRTTVSICAPPSAPSITVNDIRIPSAGGTLIATGCNGGTVTWSGGQTGPSLNVTQAGIYTATCTVTDDCGIATGSADGRVTVSDTPGSEGPKPKLEQKPWIYHTAWDVCKEATVTLEARNFPAGASFHWSNGATTEKITVGGCSYTLYAVVHIHFILIRTVL